MTDEQSSAIARALVSLRDELGRVRAAVATGDAKTAAALAAVTKSIEALAARLETLERAASPLLTAEAAARAEVVEWRRAIRSNPLVWVTVILLILSGGALVIRGDALAVLGLASHQVAPVAPTPVTGAP